MFRSMMTNYRRPVMLAMSGMMATTTTVFCEENKATLKAFSAKEFQGFPIRKVTQLSPNTKSIELALPTTEHEMGMTTASFVMVKGPVGEDGKFVARPYTPTNTNGKYPPLIIILQHRLCIYIPYP